MLSAIAARKAAQAMSGDTSEVPIEPTTTVQVPNSNAKRKKLSQKPPNQSWKKRKRKDQDKQVNKTRYFEEQQKDLSDDFDEKEGDSGMSEDKELYATSVIPAPQTIKRGWSFSRIPDDSSDEESDEDNGNREGDVIMDIHTSTPLSSVDNPDILSTFQSTLDRNTFLLTSCQVHNLHASYSDCPGTLIALQPRETLCLLGAYTFCVLQGSICFGGVNISASMRSHRVFAPRSSPLPILEGLTGIDKISGLEHNLPEQIRCVINTHAALVLLQDLRTGVEGLGRVCRTFNGVFEPSRWQKNDALGSSLHLSEVHMITHQTKDVQAFRLPSSWETALASIPISTHLQNGTSYSGSVHLVKGPKKSGKSTFARTLVNKLLTQYQRVAFLECDPGQSEFTPGGMIALNVVQDTIFGPPFTHPTLPVTAHYLGATSPRSSPLYYLAAIQAALDAYRLDVQVFSPNFTPNNEGAEDVDEDDRITDFIPLVINTMGWTKGLGADLNQKIEDMAQATDVYDIQVDSTTFENQAWFPNPYSKTAKERYPSPDLGRDVKLHLLTAIPPSVLSANYTAADHRALSILSYFHAIFPSPRSMPHVQADTVLLGPLSDTSLTAHTWETSLPLLAHPPYEVDSRAFRNLVLTGAGSEDVVSAEMGIVLNSAVVGLVTCQFDSELDSGGAPLGNQKARTGIPYTQGGAQPSPAMSNCLGIALIRSTSTSFAEGSSGETLLSHSQVGMQAQMQMHILTPLPSPYLSQVKIVVKGEMELPVWGWLDHRADAADMIAGVEQGKVPYLQLGKGPNGAVGGGRRRVRRNLMRRAQM